MARRVSLPAADDLFRPTADVPEPPAQAVRAVPDQPTDTEVEEAAAEESGPRRPSGRIRHDEKMTVYVTSDELLDIEHARLSLRGGLLTVEDLGSTNGTYLVDEAGVETRCPPHEPIPVPLGWGVDLANVPLVLWAPGR